MDRKQELSEAFRAARQMLQYSLAHNFSVSPPQFDETAAAIVDRFTKYIDQVDEYYATMAAEVFPRLFTIDVATGYRFFHKRAMLMKIWKIYNRAAAVTAGGVQITPRIFRTEPPYKVACITSIFSDYIAPAKALANFALSMDRKLFQPVMIITNQPATMERRGGFQIIPFHTTKIGAQLLAHGIDIIGIPVQDNVSSLSKYMIEICSQLEIDMAVGNSSMFNFPEACVVRSGVVNSFFDMHRGFPLYVDGMDAILHFVAGTRQMQLGPWLERGGKVIDYRDGIEIPPLPEPLPDKDPSKVVFITASNYLEQRLSPEFCHLVSRLLRDCPGSIYRLVGGCERETVAGRFDAGVRDRLEFIGPVGGSEQIMEQYLRADIYLNEFPVSGVRVCLEAMCAALPVVTMKCGDLHVNSTAAEHVGEFAIRQYSPETYYRLAMELATSTERRREVGLALRKRMEDEYDVRVTFAKLGAELLAVYEEKLRQRQNQSGK